MLIKSIIVQIIMMPCSTSLRFWENKGWVNKQDPCEWFRWYFRYLLGRRSEDVKDQSKNGKEL